MDRDLTNHLRGVPIKKILYLMIKISNRSSKRINKKPLPLIGTWKENRNMRTIWIVHTKKSFFFYSRN